MKHKIEKYISIDVGVFNSNHLFIYFMIVMGLVLGSITFPSFIPVAIFLAGVGATILVYTMGKANKVTK